MANTLKFGNSEWYGTEGNILAYNDENGNFKPLPFDFSRGSSATRVNQQGLIETVQSNDARVDYLDNANGALLLEPSRTNLLPYSEFYGSGSGWSKLANISTTDNAIISPDGTLNASLFNISGSGSPTQFYRVVSTTGTKKVISAFVKYISGSGTGLRLSKSSDVNYAINLEFSNDGATLNSVGTGTNVESYKIEDYGNKWFRVSVVVNYSSSSFEYNIYRHSGTGTDVYAIWGLQLEESSYATSYIPTQGTAQTRLADSCSQTAPDGVIGQTEGVIFLDIQMPSVTQSNTTFSIGGGLSGEYAQIEIRSDLSINWRYRQGNTDYINANVGSYVGGDRLKLAFAYKNGSSVLYKNGLSIATDNGSIGANSWNNVYFSNYAGSGKLNANVNQMSLYNTRLSNSELAALTQV